MRMSAQIAGATSALLLFIFAYPPGAWAHPGDHTFLDIAYEAHVPDLRRTDVPTPALERAAVQVGGLFPILRNDAGQTLFPPGTICEKAVISSDGTLTVLFTFPAGITQGSFDDSVTDTASELLRRYFATKAGIHAIRLLGRTEAEPEPRCISWFLEPFDPMAGRDLSRAPHEPADTPPPDYQRLYRALRGEIDYNRGALSEGESAARNAGQNPLGTGGQPAGGLAGRTVYLSAGHGWTYTTAWGTQRPFLLDMCEDYGNIDQMNFLAHFLFNAGATVVPTRPLGYQTTEIVIDDDSPNVTYDGSWTLSTSNSDNYGTAQNLRFTSGAVTETHRAIYTPNFPQAGFYPVYCYANASGNRVPGQLYRIRHAGGESQVRVNHRRVGRGWTWLGNYYFQAGSNSATGAVVVSNLLPPGGTTSQVVIADAIRFGNGMGTRLKNGNTSGKSREQEASCYWIEQSQTPTTIVNITGTSSDNGATISGPPRMAAFMHQNDSQGYNGDIFLSFHSNAFDGAARGSVGLVSSLGDPLPNQATFAALCSNILDSNAGTEAANWEHSWGNYALTTLTGGYGEISSANLSSKMCGTIIEIAFHDNANDARLMRDPKVRYVAARAQYRAIVSYFNQFDSGLLTYLPEPPVRVRARNTGPGQVTVSWVAGPSGGVNGGAATSYRLYRSTDGLAFDAGTPVAGTSTNVTGLATGTTHYFRVAAVNAGGESMPTPVVAARVASGTAPILIVNGYQRIDRFNNIPQYPANPAGQRVQRLLLRRNNSYDYVRQFAQAAAASGDYTFDSCTKDAVASSDVTLGSYHTVVWQCGEQSTADVTFTSTERTLVSNYMTGGGRIFVSGSEIGYELDSLGVAPSFYNNVLKADYVADSGGSYVTAGVAGTILAGITMNFTPGTDIYDADFPDRITTAGGSVVCANYSSPGSGGAVTQFPSGTTGGSVVNMGFPFECINSSAQRQQSMQAILAFFGTPTTPSLGVDPWTLY